jgi:hypothetical protein
MRVRALSNLLLAIVFLIIISINAQSFGISFQYLDNDMLKLYPGQNYLFKLTIQNKDPEPINVSVKIDSAIATLVGGSNLEIPATTFDRYVMFNITVPNNAQINDSYNINYKVFPIGAGEGQIPITVAYDRNLKVLVIKKPEEKPAEQQKPAATSTPTQPVTPAKEKPGILKWIFIPIILIVVILFTALLWNKSHQMSARIMRREQERRQHAASPHSAQSIVLSKPEPMPEVAAPVIVPPKPKLQPTEFKQASEPAPGQQAQKPLSAPILKQEKAISPHHYFHLRNNQNLKSLSELYSAIKNMGDDDFRHHVNSTKNDFANWIAHILEKQELANKLFRKTSKEETLELIKDELEKE